MRLLIQGGRVVDPSQGIDRRTDLLIEKGKIVKVGKAAGRKGWKTIDASRRVVVPGFIDMHVHLREPGQEYKETIETGSRAAVAGGFTSIVCMPNTDPVNDNEAVTRHVLSQARKAGLANVFPVGAITKGSLGKELAEIGEMVKAGIVAISDDGRPVENNQIMRRALEYARIFDIPVLDHCEDPALAAGGCMNESGVSTRLGLRGSNGVAEELHVVRDVMLSRVTGGRAHICHVSTGESLEWIRQAKQRGIPVTCEVTPHHFILRDEDIEDYDTNYKMNPPLRSAADVQAMLEGLADGSIDCIATDHAPHNELEKNVPFEEAANGIIGMETAIPLVWEFLIKGGIVTLPRLVELLSVNPSRILKLGRGTLQEGAPADVTIVDPALQIEVDVARFRSLSRNCPFHGWKLRGVPVMTLVGGRVVYERA